MYKRILTAVDNSPFSEACSTAALSLAGAFGGQVVGSHVYAARMHERRFRQMEATLPEEYLVDRELERQRAIHESLIAMGLQLISDSYLDALEERCQKAEIPFARKTLEGKNWEQLVEDINGSEYDLVVMGARGHGVDRPDTLGSVAMRVLRRIRTDALVIKEPEAFADGVGRPILVALDGSQEAFGALEAALALAKAYDKPVEAVAAFDPYFHYAVFHSMVEVLSEEAARLFRFKEQEQLHEEIIDNGLARLYQAHLEVAQRMAQAHGVALRTTLLTGRATDEVLSYVQSTQPWLMLLGRIGVHSRQEMDMGSVTEHMLRFAPCNLLVASRRFSPPLELWSASTLRWTEEAEAALGHIPQDYQGALRILVQRLAMEQGHTVVTASLIGEAMETLKPGQDDRSRMEQAALSVAVEALRKEAVTVYLCPQCGYAAKGDRPSACPVCRKGGETFLAVEPEALEAQAQGQGGSQTEETFDGRSLRWAKAALEHLRHIPDPYQRSRARLRIEKAARLAKVPVITLEFALRHLRNGTDQTSEDGHTGAPERGDAT
jgi:nucleotide-binding universal stress UspA family protein/predicted Zn-ribbon and HTH transcriptional regulator